MKTVGEILKTAREQRGISLDRIATYTKINLKYLEAIERNDFRHVPPAAFTKGFLHTYATLVGVKPETVLAIFRRDYDQDDQGHIVLRSLVHPIKPPAVGITPQMLTVGLSILVGVLVIGFFVRQTILFTAVPPLVINEPPANALLSSPVSVKGITDSQAAVQVNNKTVPVESNGFFVTELTLTPGEHTVVVTSTSRSGKRATQERIIYIQ